MNEKGNYEAGFGSDALKDPQRIVFITKKTSAKVKGEAGRELMSYPHVILREAIAFEILTIVLVGIALFWDAPLEQLANPQLTPNPAKAPWYFLGLQELLHYFPPVVGGVLIPAFVVVALVVIPYFNVNIEEEPFWARNRRRRLKIFVAVLGALFLITAVYHAWTVIVPTAVIGALFLLSYWLPAGRGAWEDCLKSRSLPWWVMTWFIAVSLTLTVVGTFFRGPGWSWVWPWR